MNPCYWASFLRIVHVRGGAPRKRWGVQWRLVTLSDLVLLQQESYHRNLLYTNMSLRGCPLGSHQENGSFKTNSKTLPGSHKQHLSNQKTNSPTAEHVLFCPHPSCCYLAPTALHQFNDDETLPIRFLAPKPGSDQVSLTKPAQKQTSAEVCGQKGHGRFTVLFFFQASFVPLYKRVLWGSLSLQKRTERKGNNRYKG